MLHSIAHYGFIVALSFSVTCYIVLLLMLGMIAKYRLKQVAWGVPASVGGLCGFWMAVAFGLSRL